MTIENPIGMAVIALLAGIVGQLALALLSRDFGVLRGSHFWLNHPSITRIVGRRRVEELSRHCLPGSVAVLGGVPQALAISMTLVTLLVGTRASWWFVLIAPVVYAGTLTISGAGLRRWVIFRIKRSSGKLELRPERGDLT